MSSEARSGPGARGLLTLAAFVVVVAGLRSAKVILVPFLLAVFLSILAMVPLNAMIRRRVPRPLAVAFVVVGVLGIGTGFVVILGETASVFTQSLPEYRTLLQERMLGLYSWLGDKGLKVDQVIKDSLDPGRAMNLAGRTLTQLSGVLTASFLILLTAVFILLEAASFPLKVRAMSSSPDSHLARMRVAVEKVNRYMAIKTTLSLLTGTVIGLGLSALGVSYPVFWGLLAFMMNFVPNIGSILAAIPGILLALIELGPGRAAVTTVMYLVVNISISNLIEPRFMGKGLGLSPLVVFLSLVFWGWILGPVGMLLSVPLTMTLKLALETSEDMRWIAILLGPGSLKALAEYQDPGSGAPGSKAAGSRAAGTGAPGE